jgi:hypothetical protein
MKRKQNSQRIKKEEKEEGKMKFILKEKLKQKIL